MDSPAADSLEAVTLNLSLRGEPHALELPATATISDLAAAIEHSLSIPVANQKLMVSKLGLLKHPFKDPTLAISALVDKKITLMGSTAAEVASVTSSASEAAEQRARRLQRSAARPRVTLNKTRNWQKDAEESQYTFGRIEPLRFLPNPGRSEAFLQRLRDDPGIKAAMRKHKFRVGLLTEMEPLSNTQSTHEGTTRLLGLNRNAGQVIELRLRTDAYDGYRDYKTIRNTLCHELAHNVHSPHDRNFWDLCHQIEREVAAADWKHGGHSLGETAFQPSAEDDFHDHGAWTGGEFVLGSGQGATAAGSESSDQQGVSRREMMARAAEERMQRTNQSDQTGESDSTNGTS